MLCGDCGLLRCQQQADHFVPRRQWCCGCLASWAQLSHMLMCVQGHLWGTRTPVRYRYTCKVKVHLWGTRTPVWYRYICEVQAHLLDTGAPIHTVQVFVALAQQIAPVQCTKPISRQGLFLYEVSDKGCVFLLRNILNKHYPILVCLLCRPPVVSNLSDSLHQEHRCL